MVVKIKKSLAIIAAVVLTLLFAVSTAFRLLLRNLIQPRAMRSLRSWNQSTMAMPMTM